MIPRYALVNDRGVSFSRTGEIERGLEKAKTPT